MRVASALLIAALAGSAVLAEPPTPRIRRLAPAGACRGTTVDLTLFGSELVGAEKIVSSSSSISFVLVPKSSAPDRVVAKATIAKDAQVGPVELRVVGRWGVGNPWLFWIGSHPDVAEKEPNDERRQAASVPFPCVVNGVIEKPTDVDWFRFPATAGATTIVQCRARDLGGKLTAEVDVFDPAGRPVARDWTRINDDPLIVCRPKTSGEHFVRVRDLGFDGGADFPYRLEIHAGSLVVAVEPAPTGAADVPAYGFGLPNGVPHAQLKFAGLPLEAARLPLLKDEKTATLAWSDQVGFDHRVSATRDVQPTQVGMTRHSISAEREPNDDEAHANRVDPPTEVVGRLDRKNDRDWFRFSAKKGKPLHIEAWSARAGAPTSLRLLLRRVPPVRKGETDPTADPDRLQDVADVEHDGIRAGNPHFDAHCPDPRLTFTPPEDADYLLEVRDEFGSGRADIRFNYRVTIAPPEPDFRVLVVPATSLDVCGTNVPAGGTGLLHAIVLRREGYAGPVRIAADKPSGPVNASPSTIGPGANEGSVVLEVAGGAKPFDGPLELFAEAVIAGKKTRHPVEVGTVVWPAPKQNLLSLGRRTESLVCAVRGEAPYRLKATAAKPKVAPGETIRCTLTLERLRKDFTGSVDQIQLVYGPPGFAAGPVNLPAGKNTIPIEVRVPGSAPPGEYSLVFRGKARANYLQDPANPKSPTASAEFELPSTPLNIEIAPKGK